MKEGKRGGVRIVNPYPVPIAIYTDISVEGEAWERWRRDGKRGILFPGETLVMETNLEDGEKIKIFPIQYRRGEGLGLIISIVDIECENTPMNGICSFS